MDHEGAVGRYRLHDTGDLALLQGDVEGTDLRVDIGADLIAELHRQGGIPGEEEFYVCHSRLLSV